MDRTVKNYCVRKQARLFSFKLRASAMTKKTEERQAGSTGLRESAPGKERKRGHSESRYQHERLLPFFSATPNSEVAALNRLARS